MNLTETISFQQIFTLLPTPAVLLLPDFPDFTVIEVNAAYLKIAGTTRQQVLGKRFFEAFPRNPYLQEGVLLESLKQALDEGKEVRSSAREYALDHLGTQHKRAYLAAVNVPVIGAAGEVSYILRTLRDVTELTKIRENEMRIGESLVKSEKLLRETQRFAQVGSWEVDLVHDRAIWSEELRRIYEVDEDFVPDMQNTQLFFHEGPDREEMIRVFTRAIVSGEFFDLEVPITSAKGNRKWIRITGQAEIVDGACRRIYGATQDITEKKEIQESIAASRNKLNALIQTVNGVVWEADAYTTRCSFISDQVEQMFGYTARQWLRNAHFWRDHLFSDDRAHVVRYCREHTRRGENFEIDYRMVASDGRLVWIRDRVTIITEHGKPRWIRGLMMDITEAKRSMDLEHLEKNVLELNSKKEIPLEQVLVTYLKGIESLFPRMKCSILRIKDGKMYDWASASLPETYTAKIRGIDIGPGKGSCGEAAYRKKRVIVADIAQDPRWEECRQYALDSGLHACWSEPIVNATSEVVATFGIYYDIVKTPDAEELRVIDRSNSLLKIILENRLQSEMLEETSSLMAQGQDLAHFGTWQWNIKDNTVSWSDSLYEIYDQNSRSFKASFDRYLELIHPDDRGRVYRLILDVLKTKQDVEFEERIVRPSGEIRYLKSWARLKSDEHGEPLKMVGACMDVTETKRVQEHLRASETRLRLLVESETNYVIRLDIEGRYLYANRKYVKDFGWLFDGKDISGISAYTTIAPYHHELVTETTRKCISEPNKVIQVELDNRRQDGGVVPTFWHFICLTDSGGGPIELQCIGIDLSERKKTEAALKLTTERYRYVNKATHDAIYDWDVEKDYLEWGEGFQRQFGHGGEEETDSYGKWADLVHPDDSARIQESLATTLSDPEMKIWSGEYRLKQANGQYAYVEANGYLLRDSAGKAIRMIGALRNITERKLTEQKLQELHKELQNSLRVLAASNADLEHFAYVASHDLQEPLRMVTGFLTQLEKKYGDSLDETAKKYIFFAVDGARRMRQIILDLLDYSRAGRSEDIKEEVDLDALLAEILALFGKKIEEVKARIEVKSLPALRTFRSPLRQIFQNLVDNALKYHRDDTPPEIQIRAKEYPGYWEFSVSDNGIGIEEEYFDKIFVIFQRLHSRERYSGTGLGLALAKKIVESLGGKISVKSEQGKGSVFYFTIVKE